MKGLFKIMSCFLVAAVIFCSAVSVASAVSSVSAPNIKLSNTKAGVKITWKKPKGAKKYVLLRKAEKSKRFKALKSFSSAKVKSYTDKKISAGKKYTYALKSINGLASATSASKSIVRLTAPKKLRTVKYNIDGDMYDPFSLKWSKVKGAKSYRIYRSEYDGKKWGAYKRITTAYGTKEYYSLRSGKYSKLRVTAVCGKSESAFSKSTKKLIYLDYSQAEVKREDSGVNVKWDKIGGAEKYELYRSEDEGSSKLIKTFSPKTTKYLDKDVNKGVFYSYYVIGVKDKVKSDKYFDDSISSIYFDDCDYAVELGEHNDMMPSVYSLMSNLTDTYNTYEFESSDTNILKINETKDSDGLKTIRIIGVNPGYATLTVKTKMDFGFGESEASTEKYKIRVQDTPVYLAKMKAGTNCSLSRLAVPSNMRLIVEMADNDLVITSSDTSVVDVKTKNDNVYLAGLKQGEATLELKLNMKEGYYLGQYKLLSDFSTEFKVLVE